MTTGNVSRCVECGTPWTQHGIGCAPSAWRYAKDKEAEIARLRAELDAAKAEVLGHEKGIVALGAVIDGLRSDISSARAALKTEMEISAKYRNEPHLFDELLGAYVPCGEFPCEICREYDARRAAEAKE